ADWPGGQVPAPRRPVLELHAWQGGRPPGRDHGSCRWPPRAPASPTAAAAGHSGAALAEAGMKRTGAVDPPYEQKAGEVLTLYVHAATADQLGGIVARIEAWNGHLVHADEVKLTTATGRHRFAHAAATAVARELSPPPSADVAHQMAAEVEAAAPLLARSLPAALHEAPAEADAAPTSDPAALWQVARSLAEAPDLLDQVARAGAGLGLVGEQRNLKLVYLAATARLLPDQVNVIA